jgi:hypothetical protein
MMEPISIHNVPVHVDATGRPKWDQQKRNPRSHEGRSGGSENQGDAKDSVDADATDRDTPRRGSDGIIGTQVDLEA